MRRPRDVGRLAKLTALVSVVAGCGARAEVTPADTDADDPFVDPPGDGPTAPLERSDKLDILLAIDNSRGMGDVQALLRETVPYLFSRLTEPACVNGLGNVVDDATTGSCDVGIRDLAPVTDIHIGIISTSLGGLGADTCSVDSPSFDPTMDDGALLLARNNAGGVVPTYDNMGFLWWDPTGAQTPPGDDNNAELVAKLDAALAGVGARGCGFESQLESIYRFLVDPDPYQEIVRFGDGAELVGTDEILLQQRQDFLRDDSAVLVVLISEENDCSTIAGGQAFASRLSELNGQPFRLPRARSECANDPDNPCCDSCGAPTPSGCSPTATNPACELPPYTAQEDPLALRCFDQKRRFGVDFLYPVERYVRGFSDAEVPDRAGNPVPNPLFEGNRSSSLVMFAPIVGVPWQDLALDPNDLSAGYRRGSDVAWEDILGEDGDPLMTESIDPRSGENPFTSSALAPPDATSPEANPINGHERDLPARDDLQFACTFALPTPVDCAVADCSCGTAQDPTNPICQTSEGTYSSVRLGAGARPGRRQLEVARALGDRGLPASVCAALTAASDSNQPTYAYRPAVDAMLRALRERLPPAADGTAN